MCPNAAKAIEKMSAAELFEVVEMTIPEIRAYTSPKFDRNAYQREYMRKRRAAQKAKP